MAVLKTIVAILVTLAVVLGIGGLFLPRDVHLERSAFIDAPPAAVYAVLNDLHQFNRWSPWADLDPDARYTYEGPRTGVGSVFRWHSDKREFGSGAQSITESVPNSYIKLRMEFDDQIPAVAYYKLAPRDGGTQVTWGFDGDLGANPYARYFGLILDRMLGPTYEDGLARLGRFIAPATTP